MRPCRKHAAELKQRANDIQKRHIELSHRLLRSFRNLDALESRLAASIGCVPEQAVPAACMHEVDSQKQIRCSQVCAGRSAYL